MFVFLPSLKYLIQAKARLGEEYAKATVEPNPKPTVNKRKTVSENLPQRSFASEPEFPLHKFDLDTKQKRFESYYSEVKFWNENYDHLLTEIYHALDRPAFEQAGKKTESAGVSDTKINQINCLLSLTEELNRVELDSNSLTHRFAGIHHCFMETSKLIDMLKEDAILVSVPKFDSSIESQITKSLGSLRTKANAFRCYALHRIEYYKAQKELSIWSITYARRWAQKKLS